MAEFDVKVGGLKAHADLDFNPKNIFMSIADKIDEETAGDIFKFYGQYEEPLSGLLGLGKLALGKSIDPPFFERGQHSFGIRDLNLEDWPIGVYGYNTDDFNLEAEVGPKGEDWMAALRGTYKFAEGGLSSFLPCGPPPRAGYEPWLEQDIPYEVWEQMTLEERNPGQPLPEYKKIGYRENIPTPSADPQEPNQLVLNPQPTPNAISPMQYSSSVAHHPLVNPPTIPLLGGGLDSFDRVGWGDF